MKVFATHPVHYIVNAVKYRK